MTENDDDNDRKETIRTLNDLFRQGDSGPEVQGRIVMTQEVAQLPETLRSTVIQAVQKFDAFDEDSDPHGEHDFGSVTVEGVTFFWKIDYYDADFTGQSPNPLDLIKTRRVLTIMRPHEY